LRYLGVDVRLFADAVALPARDHPRDRREWGHVHAFTFGTSLTNVTRALRRADPDLALAAAGHEASDWEGGTRIGASLERFNKAWSRRVLTSGATVMLITDGLERDDLACSTGRPRGFPKRRAPRVAQPLVALGRVFAPRGRGADAPGACGQLPRLPFARQPSGAVRCAGQTGLRDRMLAEARAAH
jgi:hypothetical protein